MKRSLAIAAVSVLLAGGAATAAVVAKDGRHHHRPKATTTLPVVTTRPAVTTTTRPATTTTAPVTTTTVCGFGPGPAGPVKSSCVSLPQVNVKAAPYNAVCNGSGDDTTAVQAAANDSAGKMLYFPAGTCRVGQINIPATASVTGVGPSSIVKAISFGGNVLRYDAIFNVGSNVSITSLKLDGLSATNVPPAWSDGYNDAASNPGNKYTTGVGVGRGYRCAIRGEAVTGLTVSNVEFTAVPGAAIATIDSSNITITNNNIHDSSWELAFIYGNVNPYTTPSGSNVTITGNTLANIHAPAGANSAGVNPDSIVLSRMNGITVSNNTLNGIDRDFLKMESPKNFLVSNNTISDGTGGPTYPAIQVSPWFTHHEDHSMNGRITGNTIAGPDFFNGVQINSDDTLTNVADTIEVDNNTINLSAGGGLFGVQADGNTGLKSLNIHNNAITGTSSFALYIYGGGTGLVLNTNTHNGSPMTNVNIPGTFPSATHTYN